MRIRGFEHYSITENGEVYSHYTRWGPRKHPKLLAVRRDGKGYHQVVLYRGNGQAVNAKVHRLVALHFLENPNDLPEINHKDENKDNNSVGNLEWCDSQYNNEQNKSKWYSFVSPKGQRVKVFNLLKFCREHDLTHANMIKVSQGVRKHHKGWTK